LLISALKSEYKQRDQAFLGPEFEAHTFGNNMQGTSPREVDFDINPSIIRFTIPQRRALFNSYHHSLPVQKFSETMETDATELFDKDLAIKFNKKIQQTPKVQFTMEIGTPAEQCRDQNELTTTSSQTANSINECLKVKYLHGHDLINSTSSQLHFAWARNLLKVIEEEAWTSYLMADIQHPMDALISDNLLASTLGEKYDHKDPLERHLRRTKFKNVMKTNRTQRCQLIEIQL
jgi:hypothetical protein